MVYHARDHEEPKVYPASHKIQPIMFLSRALKLPVEANYWITELEVACCVWAVRKLRHLIESGISTTIFTDHSATTAIARQTSLETVSIDKLNLRLVRASEYLSQFTITYVHHPGKYMYVADALSRLSACKGINQNATETLDGRIHGQEGELDIEEHEAYTAIVALLEMSDEFREKCRLGYETDTWLRRTREMILHNDDNKLPFVLDDEGLLWR